MGNEPGASHVSVDAKELAAAWRTLKRTTGARNRGELLVLHRERELIFELGGASVGVAADGEWVSQARLDPSQVFGLLPHLPKHGSVAVSREEDRIRIASIAFRCTWDPEPMSALRLPMNPSFTELLWVSEKWSRAELDVAGILSVVQEAESRRDTLLSKAFHALKPLGITEEELRELVRRRIMALHGSEG